MKASELRIGNYFLLPNGEIGRISYHEIRLLVISTEKPNYHPIPLTEEWLVKLGFDKVLSNYEEAETYDFFYENIHLNMANNSIKFNGIYIISFIPESVHQLQNLYFALTGEELTIKTEQQ